MTQDQLKEVMKFQLKNFNDEHVTISDITIHNTVLSETDNYGDSNSKNLYRAFIRWTMVKNGHEDKPWPGDWFEKDVSYLSSKII
jgi:hypothetical protein